MTNNKLDYIIRKPKIETNNPILLLMLHGYGSNSNDLFSFASELPDDLLIISAQAPIQLQHGSYAWYPLQQEASGNLASDITKAIEARDLLANFIDDLQNEYQFDKSKSMLMGFSQGAILSYSLLLSYPEKIKNALCLSGFLLEEIVNLKPNENYQNLDIYSSHGTVDPVIPLQKADETHETLHNLNVKHIYKTYEAGHGVHPNNFDDLKEWIINKIA